MLPSRELAEIAVKALDSKKGKEIRLIRIDNASSIPSSTCGPTARKST